MRSSEREDWLVRQAKAIGEMVSRISGLRSTGLVDEARAELEKAHRELSGPQADLVRRADAATAALLLGSPESVEMHARLLEEEAALEPDVARAASLRSRAEALRALTP